MTRRQDLTFRNQQVGGGWEHKAYEGESEVKAKTGKTDLCDVGGGQASKGRPKSLEFLLQALRSL